MKSYTIRPDYDRAVTWKAGMDSDHISQWRYLVLLIQS